MSVNIKKGVRMAAKEQGVSKKEFMDEIQHAIDVAWNNPECAENRAVLFPDGKPEPEAFLRRLAEIIDMKN